MFQTCFVLPHFRVLRVSSYFVAAQKSVPASHLLGPSMRPEAERISVSGMLSQGRSSVGRRQERSTERIRRNIQRYYLLKDRS